MSPHNTESEFTYGQPLSTRRGTTFYYRCTPVPCVRKLRGGWGCYYRHPRTFGAIRMSEAHLAEGFLDIRAKNLPHSWDDIPRHCEHSWKRHRSNQHRGLASRSLSPRVPSLPGAVVETD